MADNSKDSQHLWNEMLNSMRENGAFISDGVESAFSAIPRHLFLPDTPIEDVYSDRAIGVKTDASGLLTSSSSQPSMMAVMLNQLQLKAGDNVLEIGTATGYNAAIMQHIIGDSGTVTSIEIDHELAQKAQANLSRAKMSRVSVVNVDGSQGYSPRAAYDYIVSTVGVWDVPSVWFSQIKPEGSVVVPIVIDGVQVSAKFKLMSDGSYLSIDNRPCSFVYMLGQNAGPDFRRHVASSPMYILSQQVEKIDTAALHLLLSYDHEFNRFETGLSSSDYWNGYQLYLMLNHPKTEIFFVYAMLDGQKAYGVGGQGIGLFAKSSAALASYYENGVVHSFVGADSFMVMQSVLDDWIALGKPTVEMLRLRLIPKAFGKPEIPRGKLYERHEHYLHAWFEV
jgi:protein-L-isoaspartate(D-aspartate) O-methyltransferase